MTSSSSGRDRRARARRNWPTSTGIARLSSRRTGPHTEGLDLDAAGVRIDSRGRIVVDEHFRASAKGVFAAGDVPDPTLASIAMEQGRAAACHALGIPFEGTVDPTPVSAVWPEVAGAGLTEEQCQAQGIDYEVGRSEFDLIPRGAIAGHGGLLKLIFSRFAFKRFVLTERTELLEFLAQGCIGIALFLLDELCVMNKFFRAPIRTFVAGLLAVLPVALTVAVIVWVTSLVDQFVGPHSAVGKLLVSIGLTVVETRIAAYVIGIGIVLCAVYMLGLFVEAGVQRRLQVFIDSSLRRIPFVGSVYDLAHRFVGMFERKEQTDLKTMSPVWCFFGGEGSAAVLALLPTPEPILLGGHLCHVVLVPTAPVPFGGGLFFVPAEWIKPAPFGVEGLTSIYVSMGISAPQYFSGSSEARSADHSHLDS